MNHRIWIYTLSKELTNEQLADFKIKCLEFVNSWTAHDVKLDASYELVNNRLLIFKVNEESYNASGCSIDKQVRFIKEQEQVLHIELLNRMLVAYEQNSELQITHQSKIKELVLSGDITKDTLIYDNTITSSDSLLLAWKVPLYKTWLSKYITN
jgi:hypothetical protein